MSYNYMESVKADMKKAMTKYIRPPYSSADEAYDDVWECMIGDNEVMHSAGEKRLSEKDAMKCVLGDFATARKAFDDICNPKDVGEMFLDQDWKQMDRIVRTNCVSLGLMGVIKEMMADGQIERVNPADTDMVTYRYDEPTFNAVVKAKMLRDGKDTDMLIVQRDDEGTYYYELCVAHISVRELLSKDALLDYIAREDAECYYCNYSNSIEQMNEDLVAVDGYQFGTVEEF